MAKRVEQPIIADTSALVSLAVETDHNHKPVLEASATLREVSRPIILPVDVLVETVNILGKRISHDTALKVAIELLRPGSQFVLIETRPYYN
jgi:predicted nucleic acid-binding protein